ncbi:MAG TPA: APC family permease [Candidatus Polarisedimenticolia bacterium]|nr:APC family permease [Candidatus Polarisedimenticolia bacterium]
MRERSAGGLRRERKASLWQLVFLMYTITAAGAYGLEEMVGGSGPGITLLILILLPFVWAVPLSLASAELTTALPREGGIYSWVREAFGDFWGFQAGWWNLAANTVNSAAYAVLFTDYLREYAPAVHGLRHTAVCLGLIWILVWANVRGIRTVGMMSLVFTILCVLPFPILALLGAGHWRLDPFTPFLHPDKSPLAALQSGFFIAIWLYSGYEQLGTVAEEVTEPRRAYPIALLLVVPAVILTYVVPTLFALASLDGWRGWGENYFITAAQALGGPLLAFAMLVGAMISNAALLNSTLLATSRIPFAMARDGLLPGAFARTHPVRGTPWVALVLGGVVFSLLSSLHGFAALIAIYAWLEVASYALVYLALMRLRRSRPDLQRPYRVPGGRAGLLLVCLPPLLIAILTIAWGDKQEALSGAIGLLSGPLVFALWRLLRRWRAHPVPTV